MGRTANIPLLWSNASVVSNRLQINPHDRNLENVVQDDVTKGRQGEDIYHLGMVVKLSSETGCNTYVLVASVGAFPRSIRTDECR